MNEPKCAITGTQLTQINSFLQFPVFMGTTCQDLKDDKFFDLHWAVSEAGIVQLQDRYPLELLYTHSHNSGAVGGLWDQHHEELAAFISDFRPTKVIEVGAGHGILAQKYMRNEASVDWIIFEPNPLQRDIPNVTYRREFFSTDTKIPSGVDCLIHSHFFEHLYDPAAFLQTAYDQLPMDGKMIFSMPNMVEMLARGYVNSLNIEHTIYLPEYLVDALLKKFGFELVQKKYFKADHSIFYCCRKSAKQNLDDNVDFGQRSQEEYAGFISYISDEIEELKLSIKQHGERQVFLFGAHIFSQHLIYHGLGDSAVAVLDNDENKQGKRLYGTRLLVKSPEAIADEVEPIVILRAGVYNKEIAEQLEWINPSVVIV